MTEPRVRTLADLPFHVAGRFPKPVLIRHCVGDRFKDRSSRDMDVMTYYRGHGTVPPLRFVSHVRDMKALLHNA